MTNKEEVIKHLLLLKESAVKSDNDTGIINVKLDSFNFVMDMAIKALEYDDVKYHAEHGEVIVDKAVWDDAERSLQEPCDDAISRQAVLDLLEDTNNGWIINEVLRLPSVKPQEPTGHWIDREVYDADRWECSECGRTEQYKENYCPNCGARMVEPQESEEV